MKPSMRLVCDGARLQKVVERMPTDLFYSGCRELAKIYTLRAIQVRHLGAGVFSGGVEAGSKDKDMSAKNVDHRSQQSESHAQRISTLLKRTMLALAVDPCPHGSSCQWFLVVHRDKLDFGSVFFATGESNLQSSLLQD